MARNQRGRNAKRRNDYQRERSRKGVEAKRRKREALAEALVTRVTGTVTFDGPLFGGPHVLRIAQVDDGRPVSDYALDGRFCGVKTERGLRALIAAMIAGRKTP